MLEAKNKFICEEKLLLSLSDETKFLEDKDVCHTCDQDIDKTIKDAKITHGKNKVDEVTNSLE